MKIGTYCQNYQLLFVLRGSVDKKTDNSRLVTALKRRRNHESVELGKVLCARSIEPLEGGPLAIVADAG